MRNLCQLSQSQLFDYINKVSFAVNDITLFLDSHPKNQEALAYFHEHSELRNAALKEYARRFGSGFIRNGPGKEVAAHVEL